MRFYLFLPYSLLVALPLMAVEVSTYMVDNRDINTIPVIPKGKSGGINVFDNRPAQAHHKGEDFFNTLDLATQGNKNASIVSGLNVDANKPKSFHDGYKRPRIGLVLSGGGARGGAHLGVIKAFEEHNIPIDAIVGTSMGSFIGGLYAAGMSSSEIERMLTTMDWTKVITVDYERPEISFRRKKLQRAFPGHAKVGINSDHDVVFGTGLFKRQTMLQFLRKKTINVSYLKNFDELRIPFRSVASQLKDGATVVLRDGSLAESIYASIAIPGGFDPITINGEVLVDGGVADNLPLDVMREEMDVDYIVVVDISTPYDENAKFDNYISVMGQLVNILMRKNVEETITTMKGKDNEVLITPDLTGYTPLDADKYPEIIAIGYEAAQEVYNDEISHLSLYETDYYNYIANRPKVRRYQPPIIHKIEIENPTYLTNEAIRHRLHVKIGEPLNTEAINKDIMDIYNMMLFDDVSYEVIQRNGENILKIITTPSWDVNGQIKFAIGFEDDFDGHSDYSIKLEYIKFGLNSYAGEWRTRMTFGQENLLLTELYQPLDSYGLFYIRPTIYYKNKRVYVTPEILAGHEIVSPQDKTFVLQSKDYGGILGFGMNINREMRIEVMGDIRHVNPSTDILSLDSNGSFSYTSIEAEANIYDTGVQFEFDNLDKAFFPSSGFRANLNYKYSDQYSSENPLSYNQIYIDFGGVYTNGKSSFEPHIKYGRTFDVNDHGGSGGFSNSEDFSSYYTLGGLFNLSGLPSNALTGNNVSFASLVYRYRLTDDNFFGSLGMPIYAGGSLEGGGVLYGNGRMTRDDLLYAGSVYLAADTIIGPFYLGVGATRDPQEDKEYYSFHLSLGQSF